MNVILLAEIGVLRIPSRWDEIFIAKYGRPWYDPIGVEFPKTIRYYNYWIPSESFKKAATRIEPDQIKLFKQLRVKEKHEQVK